MTQSKIGSENLLLAKKSQSKSLTKAKRYLETEVVKHEGLIELSFSSDKPLERYYGTEILQHTPEAVDLERLNRGAPLLLNHDPDAIIGVVVSAEIRDGKGRAKVRFGNSARAVEVKKDVEDGVIRNVSVGYQVEETESNDVGGIVVTKWRPYEISLVSIPADISVGINRTLHSLEYANPAKPKHQQSMMSTNPYTGLDLNSSERQRYSLVRAMQAAVSGDWREAGLERECHQELERYQGRQSPNLLVPHNLGWQQRDHVKGNAASGGKLVGTDLLSNDFIDSLRNRLAIAELGARTLAGLQADVTIPTRTGSAAAYWIDGDGEEITESTGSFGSVNLVPKTIGAYSRFTRLMDLQSTPDIEDLIRQDFVQVIAQAVDAAAIAGSGASNQPLGILNTNGVGTVSGGSNGAAVTLDHLVDLKKAVSVDNADVATAGFLSNSKVEAALAKLKDNNGAYHLGPYGAELGQQRIAGRRFVVSNQISASGSKGTGSNLSTIIYGNFSDLLVGVFGPLEIALDPYSGFKSGTVAVRAMQSLDIAVRHPESFAVMTDAIA